MKEPSTIILIYGYFENYLLLEIVIQNNFLCVYVYLKVVILWVGSIQFKNNSPSLKV